MHKPNLIASLEALLFIYGEPITIIKAAKILSVSVEEINGLLENIKNNFNENNERGLMFIKKDDCLQIVTKPEFANIIRKVFEKEFREDLTPSALEVIAVLAYSGPLDRAELEYIRGINSAHTLRNLTLRGLINRDQKKYSVSFDLLKYLGLSSLEQLPEYEQSKELLKNFKQNSQNA